VGAIAVLLDFLCEGATPPLEEVVYAAGDRPREPAETAAPGGEGPSQAVVVISEDSPAAGAHDPAVGAVFVEGGLSAMQVRDAVMAHLPDLRRCRLEGLARDPGLAGIVNLTLEVGADGKVRKASAPSAAISDLELKRCLAGAASDWAFPASDGGPTTAIVPIDLGK
jgi:hypothetical protein